MGKNSLSKQDNDCKSFLHFQETISPDKLKQQKICKRCGKVFTRPANYSNKQWDNRKHCNSKCGAIKRDIRQDSKIVFQYVEMEMSSVEIGKLVGLSDTHIRRILKSNNVKIRPASENKKLSSNRPEVKEKIRQASTGRKHSEHSKNKLRAMIGRKNANWKNGLTVSGQGYLMFTSSPANGEHASKALHVVVAEWKYGRRIKPGEHVHHLDGNKKNNDPDNLVILSARQHALIHTEDRENGKLKSM